MASIPIKWGCITEYDFSKMLGKKFTKGIIKVTSKEWIDYCKARQKFMKCHYCIVYCWSSNPKLEDF